MRIFGKRHQSRKRRRAVVRNSHELQNLCVRYIFSKIFSFVPDGLKILCHTCFIDQGKLCVFYYANIIADSFSKGFIAVNLILVHWLIGLANAYIRAFDTTYAFVKYRAIRNINSRNFRRNNRDAVNFACSEQCAHRRLHLLALLCHLFLQILWIIHSIHRVAALLIYAE